MGAARSTDATSGWMLRRGGGEGESSETPRLIADALEFIAGPLITGDPATAVRAAVDLAKRRV